MKHHITPHWLNFYGTVFHRGDRLNNKRYGNCRIVDFGMKDGVLWISGQVDNTPEHHQVTGPAEDWEEIKYE